MNCILIIFIIRNDLWILAIITIKIIRCNIFNSFFLSFFSAVDQVGVYLAKGCCYIVIKRNEVFDCNVIIMTNLVKKSCENLIDFVVIASAVILLKAVNYCVRGHIFPSHLQPINCFHKINILYYLCGLFTIINSRWHIIYKQLLIFTFERSDYTSIKWLQTRRGTFG